LLPHKERLLAEAYVSLSWSGIACVSLMLLSYQPIMIIVLQNSDSGSLTQPSLRGSVLMFPKLNSAIGNENEHACLLPCKCGLGLSDVNVA
jgi:hypothetical protein